MIVCAISFYMSNHSNISCDIVSEFYQLGVQIVELIFINNFFERKHVIVYKIMFKKNSGN